MSTTRDNETPPLAEAETAHGKAGTDIPEIVEEFVPTAAPQLDLEWQPTVRGAVGTDIIAAAVRTLPNAPGVYRMIDGEGAVLYVGKARSLKKRVVSYARLAGQSTRIARMIRITAEMDFVRTRTRTRSSVVVIARPPGRSVADRRPPGWGGSLAVPGSPRRSAA